MPEKAFSVCIKDSVFIDPCCGTGGFLIAATHNMLSKTNDEEAKRRIRQDQLFGIEEQPYMFTIATTNMILRGDGKSNLENQDFFAQNPSKLQLKGCTVGMMNPPYSQGSKQNPKLYEINFTETLLKSVTVGARVAVIVPQSTFTGKTKEEQSIKSSILKKHTLEGVITLNKNTFYGVGTNPCIGIFTAGRPHPKNKMCKFINFENDGYIVSKHIGLIDDGSAKDKKQRLLDVWRGHSKAPTKFCVETTIEDTDEWLHSFYYFNDEIPTEEDFRNTIADYITFEVNMITHGRGYLFGIEDQAAEKIDYSYNEDQSEKHSGALVAENSEKKAAFDLVELEDLKWKIFKVNEIFEVKSVKGKTISNYDEGKIPYITTSSQNNGITNFVDSSEHVSFEKAISIDPIAGKAFFHDYNFIGRGGAGSAINLLYNSRLDKYNGQFVCAMIEKVSQEKASYGLALNGERLKNTKFILPIDENGNPHWDYMSKFMQNIEAKKLQKVLDYLYTYIS